MADGDKELVASVERIEELLTVMVRWSLSDRLSAALKNDKERTIYDLTGSKNQTEITKAVNVSATVVSSLWTRLEAQGLLRKVGQTYRKLFEDKNGEQ